MGMFLIGMTLMGVFPIVVPLMSVSLIGTPFIDVSLIGVPPMGALLGPQTLSTLKIKQLKSCEVCEKKVSF
jgi:hypothetical protein